MIWDAVAVISIPFNCKPFVDPSWFVILTKFAAVIVCSPVELIVRSPVDVAEKSTYDEANPSADPFTNLMWLPLTLFISNLFCGL